MNSDNEEDNKNIKHIDLKGIIGFLDFIKKPMKGKIVSNFPTLNDVEIEFFKTENCFEFISNGIIIKVGNPAPADFQTWNYGYTEPFVIVGHQNLFALEKGVSSLTIVPSRFPSVDGTINNINCIFENTQAYYKCIRPLVKNAKVPINCFKGEEFKTDEYRYWGYVTLIIGEHKFGFYDCTLDNKRQIVVEALTKLTILDFEQMSLPHLVSQF